MDSSAFQELFESQRQFFHSGKTRSLDFRVDALQRLKDGVREHEKFILEALKADLNKTEFDAYTTEIGIIYDEIKYALRHVRHWAKPVKVPSPLIMWPSKSYILKEPFGVSLIIAPWNYPFQLLLAPLVGAIGSGNTAILKPSEISMNTALVVEQMINHIFPKEYVHVVQGTATETQVLLEFPFDYIFYTGGTRVGRIIATAAAKNLTPVTLELGGKSPAIVHKDAKLKLAAHKIAWGKYLNAGQTCIAPDYVLVDSSVKEAFLKELFEAVQEFYGKDNESFRSRCKIVNSTHYQRLSGLIDQEKLVYGGLVDKSQLYISPTILYPVDWDSPILQDEIFGPILPVIPYDNLDEIYQKIIARPKPLALYLFSDDETVQEKFTQGISFGGGAINNTLLQFSSHSLPFGGVGSSGIGAYHGKASFDTFSHSKSMVKSSSMIDLGLAYPNKQMGLKRFKQLLPNYRP